MSERRSLSKEISRYAISIIILGAGVGGLVLLSQLKKAPASAEVPDKTVFVETTPIVPHLALPKSKTAQSLRSKSGKQMLPAWESCLRWQRGSLIRNGRNMNAKQE